MTDPDTLFSVPFLAASSDGGSLVIFVVIALITIVSKLIEWYKNKADNASGSEDMPTFDPKPSPRKSMEEVIRKAILEQQQKGRVSPPIPGERPVPPAMAGQSAPRKDTASPKPAMSPVPDSNPYSTATPAAPLPPEPQIPVMPVPEPYNPVLLNDINQSVAQMTDNIEKEARKTMEQAYSSAESSYNMTMDILEKSAQKAREQAKAVIANSLPEVNTSFDLRSPGALKKAVIMSEILAAPKGMK